MKKAIIYTLVLMLCISLTACGKSEFGLSENDGRHMTITARNADRDAFFMAGSLEVDKDEQILITSDLKKGLIRVEIVAAPEEQSMDVLPDMEGEAVITANAGSGDFFSGTVSSGTYLLRVTCLEKATGTIQIEVTPAEGIPSEGSGIEQEIVRAYLAVVDELAAHLGYDEAEASEGECLHGGFLNDWDGDGTPELCLLLKTSPREPDSWDGTPLYGWYAPTLCLYTYKNGQAERAGECDLYFSTAGREAAVASVMTDDGMQYVRWDHYGIEDVSYAGCYKLINGETQKTEMPSDLEAALESADSVEAFLDALGADEAQLLMYNSSGEAGIAAEQNARELRAYLSEYAS